MHGDLTQNPLAVGGRERVTDTREGEAVYGVKADPTETAWT